MKCRAEYDDDNFKIYDAFSDIEAFDLAITIKEIYGFEMLYNVFEIDDNYDEIRTIH